MVTAFAKNSRIFVTIWLTSHSVWASITTTGDVAPAPPGGGGNVIGPFTVGNTLPGTMSITGATPLTSTLNATVGSGADAVGIVTMNGLGSDWTLTNANGDLFVGASGVGSVTLSNLARLTVGDDVAIGNAQTGQGQINVTGLGTLMQIGDDISRGNVQVGANGQGIVEVISGGQVTSLTTEAGGGATGEGQITVSGEFSRWRIAGALTVGDAGHGTVQAAFVCGLGRSFQRA
ncbi:MAG: hypothetical protein WD738_07320 [Pirellulales bacterium]